MEGAGGAADRWEVGGGVEGYLVERGGVEVEVEAVFKG